MVNLVNQARAQHGLAPLQSHDGLLQVARAHSPSLVANFAHNPAVGSQIPGGWMAWGENIAWNSDVNNAHTALMNSAGHRANILNPNFTHVGIGIHVENGRFYITQVFARY